MRLEKGKLYELDGKPWRCVVLNESRARLSPAWKETAVILDRDGQQKTFEFTPNRGLDVSPNSILAEWND